MGVTRDPRQAVERGHSALGPLLVKSQERGRLEGKQGKSRPERIGSGNLGIVKTMLWQAGKAAVHQAQERIGGAMLTDVRCNDGHGTPHHKNLTAFKSGVFSHRGLRKARAAHPMSTGPGGSAGIAVRRTLSTAPEASKQGRSSWSVVVKARLPTKICMSRFSRLAPVLSRGRIRGYPRPRRRVDSRPDSPPAS